MISMNKKYKTRDGDKVRILCTDMKGIFSVVAIVTDPEGIEDVKIFRENGLYFGKTTSSKDLVEVTNIEAKANEMIDKMDILDLKNFVYDRLMDELK